MENKIKLTIDGRNIEAESSCMLLDIINKEGIFIPQLCNYPSLAPSGACRLCVVEVSKEAWKGRSKIVTSCLYPAEDGLLVSTRSEEVLKTRRSLLELYLARCPDSEVIKDLARLEGLDSTPYDAKTDADNCILCGLCTRVCQDCGPGAISTLSRGVNKFIGADTTGIATDCTGCRACSFICPTDAIPLKQDNQVLTIWNRAFTIPVCRVEEELCRGCGICEEVCPYAIPRLKMERDSISLAEISPSTCTGCGICAGSCPTGAIKQQHTPELTAYENKLCVSDLRDKTVTFACSRSPFPDGHAEIIRVSCIGSIDLSTLLYCIAAGARGVVLLCRDRESCPYSKGGENGENKAAVAGELLELCGLERKRIVYLRPDPGQEGPERTRQNYIAELDGMPSPLQELYRTGEGEIVFNLDFALTLVAWLKGRPELTPSLPGSITKLFAGEPEAGETAIYLGRLPELSLMASLLLEEPVIMKILKDTAELLQQHNIFAFPIFTSRDLTDKKWRRIIAFDTSETGAQSDNTSLVTPAQIAGLEKESCGYTFSFNLDAGQRVDFLQKLVGEKGDDLYCSHPEECLQYALLLRPGSWQLTVKERPIFLAAKLLNGSAKADKERRRINNHPILSPIQRPKLIFSYNGNEVTALKGEVITSALYAAGVTIFGHHYHDGAAQGIYCVNGQCSQCMVIADGKPVKGCMTLVREGMEVKSMEGLPLLADDAPIDKLNPYPPVQEVDVLIIGGGPAGISAAIELGNVGVDVLVVDDKQDLGGKLSLQTHNFFGSVNDCYAGYRGIDIGLILAEEMSKIPSVRTWLNATVIGVFNDGKYGVSIKNTFRLVQAKKTLFATGAREKSLAFPGCDLPGVYGAGAFQTLVNRDLVKCAEKLFIIGGGNVGLIGAYHALQAGIDVVGLVEALPQCGGYKVHEDKIKRLGVPVMTSHTVLRIEGDEKVERVITAAVDSNFKPITGTERSYDVDTVLIAVGLSPVDEVYRKAGEYGLQVYAAGDAEEIAEASAAIFSGKIVGRRIAQDMEIDLPVPANWEEFGSLLKHRPGDAEQFTPGDDAGSVFPLIRCVQEIPCNPCTEACPKGCITMNGSILSLPEFSEECIGCGSCVLACPGLAITLLANDYDSKKEKALLILPYEFYRQQIPVGREVVTTGLEGEAVGRGRVIAFKERKSQNSRFLILLEVPYADRLKVAGFRIRDVETGLPLDNMDIGENDPIVCRCERVRKSEIVSAIRAGVRDMNQLKAFNRAGLGGCNGKTCTDLILRIFREENVPLEEITMPTHRPLVAEVHLGDFVTENKITEDCNDKGLS